MLLLFPSPFLSPLIGPLKHGVCVCCFVLFVLSGCYDVMLWCCVWKKKIKNVDNKKKWSQMRPFWSQSRALHLCTLCFRWACMFGIMSRSFFLQTLAFPSLWSIKSVHKTLSQNFWGSSPILLANEWFASSGVASVLLFMKSSANSRLWYLHSCPLEVVADFTNSCFRVFLYSCHNVSVVNCWCFPWSTRSRCVT